MPLSVAQIINEIKMLTPEDRKQLLIKAKILTEEGIYHPHFFREETVQKSQRKVLLKWAKDNNISYIDELCVKLKELQFSEEVITHFKTYKEGAHFRSRWYDWEIKKELDFLNLA